MPDRTCECVGPRCDPIQIRRGDVLRTVPRPACDRCGSLDLIMVHGCTRCRACGFKADCNGW